jgi:hypothetical protein
MNARRLPLMVIALVIAGGAVAGAQNVMRRGHWGSTSFFTR